MRNWNHHTGKIQPQRPESRNTYLGVKRFKYLYLKKFVLFKIDKSISLPTINWEGKVRSKWTSLSRTRALIAKTTAENYMHAIWSWAHVGKTYDHMSRYSIPTSPKLCNFSDRGELDMEANTSFILLLFLRITKKSILMNWKPKKTPYAPIKIETGGMSASSPNHGRMNLSPSGPHWSIPLLNGGGWV